MVTTAPGEVIVLDDLCISISAGRATVMFSASLDMDTQLEVALSYLPAESVLDDITYEGAQEVWHFTW